MLLTLGLKSVSYTHLDVYKRQLLTFKVGEMVLLKSLNVGRSEDNTAVKFFRLYNGSFLLSEQVSKNTYIVTTVSYTHLDVYKRQFMN